jgi:hypothetical protein
VGEEFVPFAQLHPQQQLRCLPTMSEHWMLPAVAVVDNDDAEGAVVDFVGRNAEYIKF